jgi:hypothetical protein
MKIDKHDTYIVLTDDRDNLAKFVSYLERIVPERYENLNLVINLLKYKEMKLGDILLFLKLSNYQRSTKHSFVLVNDSIEFDDIPDELIVVPTLEEGGDIIEMEEIERDLGF